MRIEKLILSLAVALLGGGLLAPEAEAQRRPASPRRPRLERPLRAERKLQLTEQQRQQMKAIIERHRQTMQEARQALRAARQARREELGEQLTPGQRQRLHRAGGQRPGRDGLRRTPRAPGRGQPVRRRPV